MTASLDILLPLALPMLYTYALPEGLASLKRGQIIRVPFGKRHLLGVVWGEGPSLPVSDRPLKSIESVTSLCLPLSTCAFVDRVAAYTLSSRGSLLKMVLGTAADDVIKHDASAKPPREKKAKSSLIFESVIEGPIAGPVLVPSTSIAPVLSPAQQEAAHALNARISPGTFQPVVLEGLTGSGKTEIYFDAVARVLDAGLQVLVLLPEIALTSQMIRRFERRFGFVPHVWHADVTPKNRRETWRAILQGEARVVVGARSALFLPYQKLGLLVVDEEHDGAYKQEDGWVRYQGRDMAVLRASLENIPVVLVSATPSLETLSNVSKGRYAHIPIKSRFQGKLPELSLIAFQKTPQEKAFISELLREKLTTALALGEQSLLFLNRRGYAPFVSCQQCNTVVVCPECGIGFVYHQNIAGLLCHYCGKTQSLRVPCVSCETQDHTVMRGPGIEKISEELMTFLPQARVHLMSSDHITSPRKLETLIRALEDREIDILVGTQMVAKGHHFPNLTCVGILDGDAGVHSLDFRGPERMLQLLTQVAGRAGRGEKPGHVYVQTQDPHHPLLQTFLHQTQERWLHEEMINRDQHGWPPFGRLAAIILTCASVDRGQAYVRELARAAPHHATIRVLGPIPAPLFKMRQQYRWRFLVRGGQTVALQPFLKKWIEACPPPSHIRLISDIDPYQFL